MTTAASPPTTASLAAIGPSSRMEELLAVYPGAQRALFRRYHIGGCSSCGFQPQETLQQVCQRNGDLSVAEVLAHIRDSHDQEAQLLVSPPELAQRLQQQPDLKLVDIRSREEWEAARLEGAVLITNTLVEEMLNRWPKSQPIVIYDHQGRQALDAAAYFLGHGFQNVRCLRGGIDAWSLEVDSRVARYRMS